MLTREDILSMIPHQGGMCLWDRVLHWDDGSVQLQAGNHRDPEHPLRHDGQLHAIHLCEYGAQAMAVHGGLRARSHGGRAAPGVLVALREVQLHVARIDDLHGMLEAHAQVLVEAAASQQYGFRILHEGRLLAEGRAAVMLQPSP
ncbi:phosphotransferase [Stenotrophomonas sp. YIM B06876]|uniref:phosphotransferase n=1 Tax=Stenotrophomonas sp. YIM B06876 TaxID=3060211 RepID=UPI002738B5BE|nr:phosphotransferase [Stenotrophomonas sp. YIM B06876]